MEVIVGDDASTDSTRQLAEQFQARYPGLISLLPPEKNLGITKNLKRCLDACTGEYIAICEGDDYWTDVYKLQKQKDFLEEHGEFSMCFSPFIILYEETGTFALHRESMYDPLYLPRDFLTTEDLIEQNYIGNFSCCMYRTRVIRQLPQEIFEMYTVDWLFNMVCGQFGRIGFLRDWMSVYRKHSGGAWAGSSTLENHKKWVQLIDIYNEYFEYRYDRLFMEKKGHIENSIARLQTEPKRSNIRQTLGRLKRSLLAVTKKIRPL